MKVGSEEIMSTDDASESLSSEISESESEVPEDGERSVSSCISTSWFPWAVVRLPELDWGAPLRCSKTPNPRF